MLNSGHGILVVVRSDHSVRHMVPSKDLTGHVLFHPHGLLGVIHDNTKVKHLKAIAFLLEAALFDLLDKLQPLNVVNHCGQARHYIQRSKWRCTVGVVTHSH